MSKNSTKFWGHFLEEKGQFSARLLRNDYNNKLEPKRETIDEIIAYARSVRGVKVQSGDRVLVSLN